MIARVLGCVFAVLLTAGSFSTPTLAQQPQLNIGPLLRSEVCFYRDIFYRGDRFCKKAAVIRELSSDWNDQISSIDIRGPWRCTVFKDANFEGESLHVVSSIPDLKIVKLSDGRTVDFNDVISSITCN